MRKSKKYVIGIDKAKKRDLIGFVIYEKIGAAMYNPSAISKVTFDGIEEDGSLTIWNRKLCRGPNKK